jgi:hypothetical protein
MKVLLDENLPHDLRHHIVDHQVFTVRYMGWSGVKNGLLLANAASAGFDLLITMDNGVPYQQNLATLPISIMTLSAPSNDIDDLMPLLPQIHKALASLLPRTVVRIQ